MSQPRRDRIEELFERARTRPVDVQLAFLTTVCGDDAALRAEVESLLKADRRARAEWSTPDHDRRSSERP